MEVTYDQDVTWDVSAARAERRMRLDVGGTRRLARLETGGATSGTARSLRFSYTVAAADTDDDGLAAVPTRGGDLVIRHRGATIRNAAGLHAKLKHAGMASDADHLVNGTPPPAEPANRAPVYGGSSPGRVNAPPDTLVTLPVSKADFADSDGDELTLTLSASRDDVYVPGSLVYNERFGLIIFVAKNACALAALDPPLPEVYDTVVTMTATDPDGATAHTSATFRTSRTNAVCPSFEVASVNGATLTIDLDAELDYGYHSSGSAPTASEFDVSVNGATVSLAGTEPLAHRAPSRLTASTPRTRT